MRYILLTLVALLCLPTFSFASHNSYYGVSTRSLDDDIVEEVPIPVLFGVDYEDVVPDFGAPRGGGTRSHEGQDFLVPEGTPIVSPTEAVVISVGERPSAGNFVFTANPGGEVFRYMHLDHVADLDRGDKLDEGDFIGTVGDTGNAPEGAYHLHFEIRDDDNDALDPYPRLGEAYSVKEKISFLSGIIRDFNRRDRDEYAEFLVTTFRDDFTEAVNEDYRLPDEIEDALDEVGFTKTIDLRKQLDELIASIPALLRNELKEGDSGAAVTLLQLYLIYSSDGSAHGRLAAAGATGYYGSITAAAVREYQENNDLLETGVYDSETRVEMAK